MNKTFVLIQLILGVLLSLSVLLQQKGTALSESFGGTGSIYYARRGPEKFLFYATIVIALGFFGLSIAAMVLS